ncbi:hypothetical protein CVIRNUC_003959 [Coccomyxa viridis]|uniref:Uncharacterized protein n=1 Tax=Coccomyxa viridis TaxID=1274662 RepID=A0AAV1I4C5_9CHLO|nr:hypothetical protein CVIRNUC_003959 [Coccomyxa viridis]
MCDEKMPGCPVGNNISEPFHAPPAQHLLFVDTGSNERLLNAAPPCSSRAAPPIQAYRYGQGSLSGSVTAACLHKADGFHSYGHQGITSACSCSACALIEGHAHARVLKRNASPRSGLAISTRP